MSSVYTGVPANVAPTTSPTITIPSDGDLRNVASINVFSQKELDYIAQIYSVLTGASQANVGNQGVKLAAAGGGAPVKGAANLAPQAAPSAPDNGDLWTTAAALFARINGATRTMGALEATQTWTGQQTFTGSATRGAVTLTGQSTPSTPSDGDVWYDTSLTSPRLAARLNGITAGPTTAPTPTANWTAGAGLAYWKDAVGMVHIKGSATSAAGAGTTIFTLPAGYRPAFSRIFAIEDNGAGLATIAVDSGGNVTMRVGFTVGHFYELDPISFLAEQ